MALPSTTQELLDAVVSALTAATWPAAIDADEPVVFRYVSHAADFPVNPLELTQHLGAGTAVAVVVEKGSEAMNEENDEFVRTTFAVGVMTYWPNDTTGALAIKDTKGLRAIALEVRKTLRYQHDLADSLWLARKSGSAILVDGSNAATGWVAQELTFVAEHMDILPA